MPVKIVPNNEVLTDGSSGFILDPSPTTPLYQDMVRLGPNPILYETINPGMTITVQAIGGCPLPGLPELITSITLIPGESTGGSGSGCNIIALSEIADKPVTDIPEFLLPQFYEPSMQYGSIAGPPSPTMALVAPLRGFYGEKYFYDAEYIYASYYRNSQLYDPVDGKAPKTPTNANRLTSVSLLGGKKVLLFENIPKDIDQIEVEMFPSPGIPIKLDDVVPQDFDASGVLTYGNDYLQSLIPEISSWVKWKPSFIEIMKYNYTLIVTHTCPPFVTIFTGYMLVQNNWTPAANRLSYYISQQRGFLDVNT